MTAVLCVIGHMGLDLRRMDWAHYSYFFFFFFFPRQSLVTRRILVPRPGIEPRSRPLDHQEIPTLFLLFFKKKMGFIYLFIYGCVGFSFLCEGFL